MINLTSRSPKLELLDQEDIPFADIRQNMKELNTINTLLGGHNISIAGIKKILKKHPAVKSLTVCEIGCGGGDNLKAIEKWADANSIKIHFTGIDIKAACIEFARQQYPLLNAKWIVADYRAVEFGDDKPDIIFASLFCHHFQDADIVPMLQWMKANSVKGFFINDLHRHRLAYFSIKLITGIFSRSYLVKNDAPLSVARGFKTREWIRLIADANLANCTVQWEWAFRHLLVYCQQADQAIAPVEQNMLGDRSATDKKYDISVIGGGLAGLALSIQLAEKGYSVVLFEKEQYPFHKVCGEYISMESYDFLKGLGLPLQDLNLPMIKKLIVSAPDGNFLEQPLPLGGFGISRFMLDNALKTIAVSKGVILHDQCKVNEVRFTGNAFQLKTNSGVFHSKLCCGSFGKRSNIDIQLKRSFITGKTKKLNNYIGVKYHLKTNFPVDTIALHNFKNGYCGISKIEEDRYCCCYLTNADNLKANNNSIPELEKNVLFQNKFLKQIFETSEILYKSPVTISQVSFEKKSQVADHILMLGDAAGMITPLCGNGMSMAMHSSKIAAGFIEFFFQEKINRSEMEYQYSKKWEQTFSKRLATGRLIQKLFGKTWVTNQFVGIMKYLPGVTKLLIRQTHGKPF